MRVGALAFITAGTVLVGSTVEELWNTKDVAEWTQQDAQQIVTRSPWAKQTTMPISQRPGISYLDVDPAVTASSPPTAELGNTPTPESGTRPVGRTPSLGSAPVGSPETQPLLRIVWASALPVRLAVLRLRPQPKPPTAEQLARGNQTTPNYVLAVVGLPPPDAGTDVKGLAGDAFLSVRGRSRLAAFDSDYHRIGSADVYFFRFSKAAMPLTIADKEVEFRLTVGRMDLKQKFQLADMKFHGQLAL